jgi:DNA mismatch endonuclease (patch repair protein)
LTGGQRHTSNITSGQFGRTIRNSFLRNKKIKTPPPHKKNKILLPTHIAHICLPPLTQANTCGSQKSAISQRFIYLRSMSDVHDKQTRSYNMSQIKGKDTKPEIQVRKFLFANGYRYKLHDKKLSGKPDIVLPKLRTAIFVHGCFWHGHENCRYFVVPKTRTKFWLNKIQGNKQRDLENFSQLKNEGWKVFTIFECELKAQKQERTLNKILTRLNKLSSAN